MSEKKDQEAQERALKNLENGAQDDYTPNMEPPVGSVPQVQQQPSAASFQLAGYVVMAATMICGVLAQKRGAHWVLSESETGDLHAAVARVADRYISLDLNNPLMQLAAVVGAIAVPRLAVEFMNQPVATQEQKQNGD